jgi:UDP-galactopyranose mutase
MCNKKYLVVGSGFYGSVFSRILAEAGHEVHIVEQRDHIAGNCFTKKIENIPVHMYGPHAFHTNSLEVWNFLNRFANFNDFKLQIKVQFKGKMFSFPINMFTLNQVYGVTTVSEAKSYIDGLKSDCKQNNFKNYILSNLGHELYDIFFDGYTSKQWNINPSELPDSIAKRVPIRYEYNDFYFTDKYQGVPIGGYTVLFENMLDHRNIKINLQTNFFENKAEFEHDFDTIVYSGKIDELFDYRFGLLGYRSLRFEHKTLDTTYQGNSIINFTEKNVPYTRIVEHKYFEQMQQEKTVITYEYPEDYAIGKIPFYPFPVESNQIIYQKYKDLSEKEKKYIIGGRLGRYLYLNMDQVVAMALKDAKEELGNKNA